MEKLKEFIREVPDFPKPVDKIVGIESRGFMFGSIVAYNLNAGFVPMRKPGKLPAQTVEQTYELEYGEDSLEMHSDGIAPGERVLIVDDLIAIGGTAAAAAKLVEAVGGIVVGLGFVVELGFLEGRKKLEGYSVESLIKY